MWLSLLSENDKHTGNNSKIKLRPSADFWWTFSKTLVTDPGHGLPTTWSWSSFQLHLAPHSPSPLHLIYIPLKLDHSLLTEITCILPPCTHSHTAAYALNALLPPLHCLQGSKSYHLLKPMSYQTSLPNLSWNTSSEFLSLSSIFPD